MDRILRFSIAFIFTVAQVGIVNSQSSWSKTLDNIGTFSSARVSDLNKDGVKDILFGAGRQEFEACDSSIIAFDGLTGELLWTGSSIDQIFGSALLFDIDGDEVDDVIIGGRSGELIAMNGSSGEELWRYYHANDLEDNSLPKIFNFYNPQHIPDQDADGVKDIIVSNGGDVMVRPHDPNRPAGHLIIVSGKTGKHIAHAAMPDGKEIYMSVTVSENVQKGDIEIIFGTGGETIGGNLYVDYLSSVLKGDLSGAKILHTSESKGYISPVARADFNKDGMLDIVANSVDGRLVLIDGSSFEVVWQLAIPGTEAYSMPCLGHFNGDDVLDIFISYGRGIWPNIEWGVQKMINGKTGEIEFEDELGYYQSSSPIAVDLTGDGIDEVMMSFNFLGKDSIDQRIFQNSLIGIEFKSKEVLYLATIEPGSNLATTPWVGDLDDDGFLDFVYCHSIKPYASKYNFDGIKVHRLTTQIPVYKELKWSSYQGSNYDGIYRIDKQKIR